MGDLLDNAPVVVKQMPPILGDSDPCDPLVQLLLTVNTQVFDVFRILGLNIGMLDAETVFCWCLVLSLPSDAIINLI